MQPERKLTYNFDISGPQEKLIICSYKLKINGAGTRRGANQPQNTTLHYTTIPFQ